MVGQYVEDILLSLDLSPDDIPKALGLFMVAKGGALATGLVVGLRYQPLRRFVLSKSLVAKNNPWVQQQRVRFLQTLDKARRADRGQSVRPWAQQQGQRVLAMMDRARSSSVHRGQFISAWALRQRTSVAKALEAGKRLPAQQLRPGMNSFVESSQAQARSVNRKLRTGKRYVGQKLMLLKQVSREQRLAREARRSLRGWISEKYWNFADSVGIATRKSGLLLMISRRLGIMPKTLVLGTAEGLLLAKLTVPLLAPLSLLLFVTMFKHPNSLAMTAAQTDSENDHGVE